MELNQHQSKILPLLIIYLHILQLDKKLEFLGKENNIISIHLNNLVIKI
jgi:hypothetical protein